MKLLLHLNLDSLDGVAFNQCKNFALFFLVAPWNLFAFDIIFNTKVIIVESTVITVL
jgi:hypothetical protein